MSVARDMWEVVEFAKVHSLLAVLNEVVGFVCVELIF